MRAFAFFFLFSLSSTLLVASANQLKHVRLIKNEIRLTFSQDYDKSKIKHFRLEKP
ncbi:MAG: N-acetylmuramoyl-L-alanine amidase, partial [Sulfurovum sp.]